MTHARFVHRIGPDAPLLCLVLFVAILSAAAMDRVAAAAPSGEWPQWRGPRRDNVSDETGLLKEWPEAGPPLAWKIDRLGLGYASVSVAGGRLFTMGEDEDVSYVYAIDPATGGKLWATKVGPPGGGNGYPGPRCTPTVDGEFVYAVGQHGDLLCLKAATGEEIWRRHLVKDFKGLQIGQDLQGRTIPPWGYSESLLIEGDQLVCTPGGPEGTLIALNKSDGKVLWRTKEITDTAVYPSPMAADIAGRRQIVQLTGDSLFGVAAEDGRVLWRVPRKGGAAVAATPVIDGDLIFVTSSYGVGCNLYRVTAEGGRFKAQEVYASKGMKNLVGGVVRVGDYLYGSDDPGLLKCIEFKTGKELWKDRSVGKGAVSYADGHLYLRSEVGRGTVALVEATPEGYREKGQFDQPGRSATASWPQPVIVGGKLYLRDQGLLLCYDVSKK